MKDLAADHPQQKMLRLILAGHTNGSSLVDATGKSSSTVRRHLAELYRRTKTSGMEQLILCCGNCQIPAMDR
jgi:hypothetical protein